MATSTALALAISILQLLDDSVRDDLCINPVYHKKAVRVDNDLNRNKPMNPIASACCTYRLLLKSKYDIR